MCTWRAWESRITTPKGWCVWGEEWSQQASDFSQLLLFGSRGIWMHYWFLGTKTLKLRTRQGSPSALISSSCQRLKQLVIGRHAKINEDFRILCVRGDQSQSEATGASPHPDWAGPSIPNFVTYWAFRPYPHSSWEKIHSSAPHECTCPKGFSLRMCSPNIPNGAEPTAGLLFCETSWRLQQCLGTSPLLLNGWWQEFILPHQGSIIIIYTFR